MFDTHFDLLTIAYRSYLTGDYSYIEKISKYFNDNNVRGVFANLYFILLLFGSFTYSCSLFLITCKLAASSFTSANEYSVRSVFVNSDSLKFLVSVKSFIKYL